MGEGSAQRACKGIAAMNDIDINRSWMQTAIICSMVSHTIWSASMWLIFAIFLYFVNRSALQNEPKP